jgi:GTP cyclohydrolase II
MSGAQALDDAIVALRRGEPVLVGGGILAVAAELASEQSLQRLREISPRPLAIVLTRRRAVALGLAPRDDLSGAVSIAIVPELPAAVIRNLADPAASLGAEPPGLGPEPTPAEPASLAAVTLAKLAGLLPAALVLALGSAEAALARRRNDLAAADIGTIMHRRAAMAGLTRVAEARVPLSGAEDARLIAFRPGDGGSEHLAIMIGAPDRDAPALIRLHSECFTGDRLGSLRCDCGEQLRGAIDMIGREGGGALLYLAQEGRGIGLVNKLRAYQLQEAGFDTIDANEQLGFDADERVYLPAAEMLRQLGFMRVRLLTNNPDKVAALERYGVAVVERVPHVFPANRHNERYLRTKATRSGHLL